MNSQHYIKEGEKRAEKHLLPKDIGITSRQVNYWKNRNVLPFFKDNKHGKMDIYQAIWLLIINELSSIGINTDRLEKLAKDIWDKPRKEKYLDTAFEQRIKSENCTEEERNHIKNILDDKLLMDTLRMEYNRFTSTIDAFLVNKSDILSFIYVPNTGECFIKNTKDDLLLNLSSAFSTNPFICIPIRHLILRVLKLDISTPKKNLNYLSSIENQIRDIVMFKRPKIVEIAFDDNHIKPRIITEKHVKKEEIADFLVNSRIPKGAKLLIDERAQGNYKLTLITK